MIATIIQKVECDNAKGIDGERVLCTHANDWINIKYCAKWSPNAKERTSQRMVKR